MLNTWNEAKSFFPPFCTHFHLFLKDCFNICGWNLITTNSAKRPISEIFNWKDLKGLPARKVEGNLTQTNETGNWGTLTEQKTFKAQRLSKQEKPNQRIKCFTMEKITFDYIQECNWKHTKHCIIVKLSVIVFPKLSSLFYYAFFTSCSIVSLVFAIRRTRSNRNILVRTS